MYETIEHIFTLFAIITAFWLGYKAGRKEERIFKEIIPDMELINTEKEEVPMTDVEIRKDMEYTRTISSGYDIGQN